MKILALDASTQACSVALLIDGQVSAKLHWVPPRQHHQVLLPTLNHLLQAAKLKLAQFDLLAFGHGPGSFTGLRLAGAIIQGLAFSTQLPVIGISTLAAVAQYAYRCYHFPRVFVANNAYMGGIYAGAYQLDDNGIMQALSDDVLVSLATIKVPTTQHWLGVGSAWSHYQTLSQAFNARLIRIEEQCYAHAKEVAYLAQYQFSQGNYKDAFCALPVYLHLESAWKQLPQR